MTLYTVYVLKSKNKKSPPFDLADEKLFLADWRDITDGFLRQQKQWNDMVSKFYTAQWTKSRRQKH